MGLTIFMNNSGSWVIHGSRLLQLQGEVQEAVLEYCEWGRTKQMH
jgi:hypothetical protein